MGNELIRNIIRFVALVLLQILVLNNIQFSGLVNPFLYIAFILLLPFETPKQLSLLLAFLLGLTIDMFTDTGGLHTFACVFLAFVRPAIITRLGPQDGYPFGSKPTQQSMGTQWFFIYAILLTLIHHLVLFYAEAWSFSSFFFTLFKAICSSFFTIILLYIYQLFTSKSKKGLN